MAKEEINIIWLKRDLRLGDHHPFWAAAQSDFPSVILYIFESSLIQDPHYDLRHFRFIWESLQEMNLGLKQYDLSVQILYGEVLDIFKAFNQTYRIRNIYSYQETGLGLTFKRDKAVARFCKNEGIDWKEFFQDGVRRRLYNRKVWTKIWEEEMSQTILPIDFVALQNPSTEWEKGNWKLDESFQQAIATPNEMFQPGGTRYAWKYLHSFYKSRGKTYMQNISKPFVSRKTNSRISPYLAWGNISIRQAYQFGMNQGDAIIGKRNHRQFISRLWWRSHFMQKFETDCSMEFYPVNRGFLRLNRNDEKGYFNHWKNGTTGFPMVDASVRCLKATGYINFRMRAMLTTFATFSLWLDWRAVSYQLSSWYLDFEPGIHYGQVQMQSGNNGYNTLRIYSPTKQVTKNDPDARFIKKWCPELKDIPNHLIAEPWLLTEMEQTFYNCRIGKDYPRNIINFRKATKEHKDFYWSIRQSDAVQSKIPKILKKMVVPNSSKARSAGLITGKHNDEIE